MNTCDPSISTRSEHEGTERLSVRSRRNGVILDVLRPPMEDQELASKLYQNYHLRWYIVQCQGSGFLRGQTNIIPVYRRSTTGVRSKYMPHQGKKECARRIA